MQSLAYLSCFGKSNWEKVALQFSFVVTLFHTMRFAGKNNHILLFIFAIFHAVINKWRFESKSRFCFALIIGMGVIFTVKIEPES